MQLPRSFLKGYSEAFPMQRFDMQLPRLKYGNPIAVKAG